MAVGTVATTGLAHRAPRRETWTGCATTLGRSLCLVAFLTVPATAGLMVLGRPIVRLLFERGRFRAADTEHTAAALVLFSDRPRGLHGREGAGAGVLRPRHAARAAARPAPAAVAANLVVIVLSCTRASAIARSRWASALGSLRQRRRARGLAFERRVGGLCGRGLPGGVSRSRWRRPRCGWRDLDLGPGPRSGSWARTASAPRPLTALGPVLLGVAVYLALAWLLRVPEIREVLGPSARRFGRS